MANHLSKSQMTPALTEEELLARRHRLIENSLFASLGAICALVAGLGLYGDLKSPAFNERNPASEIAPSPTVQNADIIDER